MRGKSGKGSAVVLWVAVLCAAAVGGGYYAGRYVIGEEYLKKSASQVRTPQPIAVKPRPAQPVRAGDGEAVVTITPVARPRPESEPEPEAEESEGEESAQPGGQKEKREELTIQLGSFGDKANADLLVEDLKQHGVSATTASGQQEGRALHRVRTGSYTSRQQAEAAAEELRRRGYNAVIVPKE